MSKIYGGGYAFPGSYSEQGETNWDDGLTKREWFAGMALGAVYTSYMEYSEKHGMDENWRDGIAGDAFKMADSMIRAGKGENK